MGGDALYYPVSSLMIEYLILVVIDRHDSYGYEISQTVKLVASIKESTLYPILKRMESSGYVCTYKEDFQGRTRKYYSITEQGKEQLRFLAQEWISYRDTIQAIIDGRL